MVTAGANFAVQQRGDRWIRLTNAGDEPTIGELLQAITLTSDGIAFEPVDGFVEIDASTGKPAPAPNTVYTAAFTDGGTATFTVSTATASSPLFAALLAAQRVEQVTINGRDGWLVVTKSDGGSSHAVNWQATPTESWVCRATPRTNNSSISPNDSRSSTKRPGPERYPPVPAKVPERIAVRINVDRAGLRRSM